MCQKLCSVASLASACAAVWASGPLDNITYKPLLTFEVLSHFQGWYIAHILTLFQFLSNCNNSLKPLAIFHLRNRQKYVIWFVQRFKIGLLCAPWHSLRTLWLREERKTNTTAYKMNAYLLFISKQLNKQKSVDIFIPHFPSCTVFFAIRNKVFAFQKWCELAWNADKVFYLQIRGKHRKSLIYMKIKQSIAKQTSELEKEKYTDFTSLQTEYFLIFTRQSDSQ